ncbi:hypothetical protein SBD_3092 [Streptomyces bottropensis ATCC 25435]|uniref:Uncharacterized protein n=1 Tax=Streptomyces bottropensis ATCC 25435 TaxID=1054862 RepID=M3FU85_9ACTN|nr:hypothetical protein SBD_3092 [Streptomyces bottropensis ATCC 25435]
MGGCPVVVHRSIQPPPQHLYQPSSAPPVTNGDDFFIRRPETQPPRDFGQSGTFLFETRTPLTDTALAEVGR